MRVASAFAVLILAALGGSSALASGALPGDALYSVKIHVNENVERTLARSPEAKAGVDIKHAEERLSEVELLAAKGDADPADVTAAATEVAANIASAADTARDLSESGDEAKADSISARISSTLLAHADILDAQAGTQEDPASGQDLRALSFAVSATADEATASQEESASTTEGNSVVSEEVALSRQGQVKDLIQKLTDALDRDGVPQETHDELLSELAAIESDYGAALAQVSESDFESAGPALEKLEQRAYRALALLRSAHRINETTGKDVVITLDDSTTSGEERRTLMKAAATLAPASTEDTLQTMETATNTATSGPVWKKGEDDGRTLEFRVRARSWRP